MFRKGSISWGQRIKIKWAKEGDCDTTFFHRVVSGRRNKNRIGPLILENGESTRNDKEVEEEVLSTFSELFNLVVWAKKFVDGLEWSPISFGRMRSWWSLSFWMKLRRAVFGRG